VVGEVERRIAAISDLSKNKGHRVTGLRTKEGLGLGGDERKYNSSFVSLRKAKKGGVGKKKKRGRDGIRGS